MTTAHTYILVDTQLNLCRVSASRAPTEQPFSTYVLHAAAGVFHPQSGTWVKCRLDAGESQMVSKTAVENVAVGQAIHLSSFKSNPGTRRPVGYHAHNGFRAGLTSMGTVLKHS